MSDLHLELDDGYERFGINRVAEYLALAGNIGRGIDEGFWRFLHRLVFLYKIVFFVPGDNECYSQSKKELRAQFHSFTERIDQERENTSKTNRRAPGAFVLLDQTRFDLSPKLTILGCTLYTKIKPEHKLHVRFAVAAFRNRRLWSTEDHNRAHDADVAWLNAQVASIEHSEPDRTILIITHYCPTTHTDAVNEHYSPRTVDSAYWTDLSAEPCCNSPAVQLWVFGHTRKNCCFRPAGARCIYLSNQRGLELAPVPGFMPTGGIQFTETLTAADDLVRLDQI
jgi:hypothetical protein